MPKNEAARIASAIVVVAATAALLSFAAARTKSATFDESLHVVAAWMNDEHSDFRLNAEHPVLWKRWAAVLQKPGSLTLDPRQPLPPDPRERWNWAVQALYHSPGAHADELVQRSRAVMPLFLFLLVVAAATWSWRAAGAGAAVLGAFLAALDPNFLGHAALVTNDVPLTCLLFLSIFFLWRTGTEATLPSVVAFAVAAACAPLMKFSGAIAAPFAMILLAIRSLDPNPWRVFGRDLVSRKAKSAFAAALLASAAAVFFAATWLSYDFHYLPAKNQAPLPMRIALANVAYGELAARHPGERVTPDEMRQWRPSAPIRLLLWSDRHHLLPQAWTWGFIQSRGYTGRSRSFLLGNVTEGGHWYYFPVAFAVKSPLALLAAIVAALFALRARDGTKPDWWLASCLALPPLLYFALALRAPTNIGIRHLFPVYPFLWVIVAITLSRLRTEIRRIVLTGICVVAAAEALGAFPNYIAFFNAFAGGARGGIRILGDSNLDWGQDLKLLARWQHVNGVPVIYLSYFGTADPAAYRVEAIHLPGGYGFDGPQQLPSGPAIIAVSATNLQGIYQSGAMRNYFEVLRKTQPIDVLGGTIYLYRVDNPSVLGR